MPENKRVRYKEAAEYLGIAEYTLRRWVSERRVPYYKVGKFCLFSIDELEIWIKSHKVEPSKRFRFVREC